MTLLSVTPRLVIAADDTALPAAVARTVGMVTVRQNLSQPSECEVQFYDPSGEFPLAPGTALRIAVEGSEVALFEGEVIGLRHQFGPDRGRTVQVQARDRLHRLGLRQPVRTHVQQTLPELARTLVADLGLQVHAADDGPRWQQWIQHRQSDLQLLQQVASRCGLYFTLRGEELLLLTLEGVGEEVALRLGQELLEAAVHIDGQNTCSSVDALAWNPWRSEKQAGNAGAARSGRDVGASVTAAQVGGDGGRTIASVAAQDSSQSDAIAQALLDQCCAAALTMNGVASGDTALVPGVPIRISGLESALDGRYVLTSVIHRIDRRRGFLTEFDTAPPGVPAANEGSHVAYGEVTQVNDPERLGRVRVALPCHGDVESDWLEVLLPAAGAGKGLIALPDVGDRVLLLLVGGDPAQAIVLGGLYGPTEPPDAAGVEGGAVRRFHFMTPGGQLLRLDDEARSARLESHGGNFLQLSPGRLRAGNSDGSYLELTEQRVRLHAARDLEIEAPGRSIVIRGQSIDFERA